MRIISLLASGTEIVCALGAGESLVGRSHECDNPPWVSCLPVCSAPAFDVQVSSREIDAEVNRRIRSGIPLYVIHSDLIQELAPDLVITQTHCDVCAVTPADVDRSGCDTPAASVLALTAGSLDGVFEGISRIAEALGREPEGAELIRREQFRLDRVRERTAGRRPSVVVLEWMDPLFSMGNWGPELVEIAGGDVALGSNGQHSTSMLPERLLTADPEFLIIAPCGFNLERALEERDFLEHHPWWHGLRAVREGKVACADGNLFFNRSGMTISRTAEIIAEILHGVTFGSPTRKVHWQWIGDAA